MDCLPSDIVAARPIAAACLLIYADAFPKWAPPAKVEPVCVATRMSRAIYVAGFGAHIDMAPHILSHKRLAIEQPSPRNSKSTLSFDQQTVVWQAAKDKRIRKEQARRIQMGQSIEGDF